jgi:prophage antirepressor-like protein
MILQDKVLTLRTESVALEILPVLENGWTQVYFIAENQRYFLGAETLNYILNHLLDALGEKQTKPAGSIEGEKVFWILSLCETHQAIYAVDTGKAMRFYIQNKNAEIIFRYNLSVQERHSWQQKIVEFLSLNN